MTAVAQAQFVAACVHKSVIGRPVREILNQHRRRCGIAIHFEARLNVMPLSFITRLVPDTLIFAALRDVFLGSTKIAD